MSRLRWPWTDKPKKPVKHYGKTVDPEKQSRKIAHNHLMKELKEAEGDDRREIIGQILGLKLKPKETKSIEDQIYEKALIEDEEYREAIKQARLDAIRGNSNPSDELDEMLVQSAIEEIQSNPDLRHKAIGKKIQQIIGGRNSGSSFSDFLEELDQVDELRDRLGVGEKEGGFVPQVIAGFTKNLPEILAYLGGRPIPPDKQQVKIYNIENPDGSIVKVDADTYIRLLEQQRQLTSPETTRQEAPTKIHRDTSYAETPLDIPSNIPQEDTYTVQTQPEPHKNIQNSSLGIANWLPYLDEEPSIFAYTLQELATGGDEQSQLAISFMQSSSIKQVVSLLEQFRDTSEGEVREVLDRILTDKIEWLGEVVELIKTIRGEEHGTGV